MKNIGPCKILRKCSANAYEIELQEDMKISPIFNVVELYPYRMDGIVGEDDQSEIQWMQQMPIVEKLHIENVLEKRIAKRIKRKVYYEFLVKWKDRPIEDDRWLNEA
jgi:hypothetical protein